MWRRPFADKQHGTAFHVNRKELFEMQTYMYANDREDVSFYTGLQNVLVLQLVFNLIRKHINKTKNAFQK